jgi:hypothetical protein
MSPTGTIFMLRILSILPTMAFEWIEFEEHNNACTGTGIRRT